ncbi:acyl-CoA thioesterase [Paenibacillaceae bacterium]|nr:acyl-CoA thioesterase [Paenibacillaceae bacterium]
MDACWHLHPLRVRYQETDRMAVVFHGNYINWFEIGRTEMIRHAGLRYRDLEQHGLLLPVIELESKFIMPALYDDFVLVCTRISAMTPVRIAFESQVRRIDEHTAFPELCGDETPPGELLVRGTTRHAWVNKDFQPCRLDKAMPEVYRALQLSFNV